MINIAVLVLVVIWFARTSARLGQNQLIWGLAAAFSYFIVSRLVADLAFGVLIAGEATGATSPFLLILASIAGVVAGLAASFAAYRFLLSRVPVERSDKEDTIDSAD